MLFRSEHICPQEDGWTFYDSTCFCAGGIHAVSSDLVRATGSTRLKAIMREIVDGYTPTKGGYVHEFVMERSWKRLWGGCRTSERVRSLFRLLRGSASATKVAGTTTSGCARTRRCHECRTAGRAPHAYGLTVL
eukprot:1035459-Prymnesium_polylepis.1